MKKTSIITAVIFAVLFSITAFADETPAPEETERLYAALAETGNYEKSPSSRYYKHVNWFGEIKSEAIRTDSDSYVFYLDSDNMRADMHAEVMPLNASDTELHFSSADENIASVSADGVISAVNKTGKTTIYISSSTLYKECAVEVRRAVTGISLSASDLSFYADEPVTAKLSANVYPTDATNKNVSWKSSDTSVAGVDEDGNVSVCGVGTAQISAVTEDGGFTASCVVRSTVKNISVKGVFITNPVETVPVGSDYALTYSVYPESAANKSVSFSSSDPNIISVTEGGVLHASAEGFAVITVSAQNGCEDNITFEAVSVEDGEEFVYISTAQPLEERIKNISVPVVYDEYNTGYDSALKTQLGNSPVVFTTNSRSASQSEVERYLNPENLMTGYEKYQFLDLRSVSNVSARMLNVYLSDKGILKGKGEIFRAAAEKYHVNAAYAAIHACLESGSGTSKLACGTEYNGAIVYNMFGIGAYDDDPENAGAKYAYEQGWTSVDAAIDGGVRWISENYINSSQNTLYKMRWNPARPGHNQYATDVGWASKQAKTLAVFMEVFPTNSLIFEVPVYAGSEKPLMRY